MSLWSYLADPLLRGPTVGSLFMCLAAALVGVIAFVRKRSLLSESLAHATYPGVILAVVVATSFISPESEWLALWVMVGAAFSALVGLWVINLLERVFRVAVDSALAFVLSAFFGVGLLFASHIQFSHTSAYTKIQAYLYGQPATMTDLHIVVYGALSLSILVTVLLFFKEIRTLSFDKEYARSIGMHTRFVDALLFFLLVLSVVVGIRTVGLILMAGMLVIPATAARQFSNRLGSIFGLAALVGVVSGFLGNYLSVEWTQLSLPTGPMIVLVAAAFCAFSLLFAPQRGWLFRGWRAFYFQHRCRQENLLKALWQAGQQQKMSVKQLVEKMHVNRFLLYATLLELRLRGWVSAERERVLCLTEKGRHWAARIVRLHRLWEVYLVDHLGIGVERVHHSAEEMEHIITPELERQLTELLKDPKRDPHHQPIPPRERI